MDGWRGKLAGGFSVNGAGEICFSNEEWGFFLSGELLFSCRVGAWEANFSFCFGGGSS
jgi:hypothetical protein